MKGEILENPRVHVERIRREIFGLASDGTLRERNPLAEKLQRAIEHLSQELYSKDIHFILELIQNAEDNRYAAEERPDLRLYLLREDPTKTPGAEGALLLFNNERGFRDIDVDALCDVGKSTKKKRFGYIGEKGIGFKSVFRVSDTPHLFSAGYAFRFDCRPDPAAGLGFIVPYWVEGIPERVIENQGQTCILLPLKSGQREEVAVGLETIAPETILFLQKIEALAIDIEARPAIEIVKDGDEKPLVTLLIGEDITTLWVWEEKIDVREGLEEPRRDGVSERTVSVAFPLLPQSDEQRGRIFAFLPTEVQSGLPFIVNADFLLSSSREAILFDRPWNGWLRDCIAPAFVSAFEALLHHEAYRLLAYRFIPLKKRILHEFFEAVADDAYQALRESSVVLTWPEGELVKPEAARFAPRSFRSLLNPDCLPPQLTLSPLVDPALESFEEQLRAIGVRDLTQTEILACLHDGEWLLRQSDDWFVQLYEYLRSQSWAASRKLNELPIIPLSNGMLRSVGVGSVYFPDEEAATAVEGYLPPTWQEKLGIFRSSVWQRVQTNAELARWLEATLGIKKWQASAIYVEIARLLNEHCTEIDADMLLHYSGQIIIAWSSIADDVQRAIVQILPLLLADSQIIEPNRWWQFHLNGRSDDLPILVTPESLDPDDGWQLLFPLPGDRHNKLSILSDRYVEADADRESLREFFWALGATDAPLPLQQQVGWENWSERPADLSVQALDAAIQRWSTRGYWVTDWRAPAWLGQQSSQVESSKPAEARAKALIKWIECRRGWLETSLFSDGKYGWYYYQRKERSFKSEFKHALRTAYWLPSTQGCLPPNQVFADKLELRELFGDALPYTTLDIPDEVENWLGIRTQATVDQLLDYLVDIAKDPANVADQGVIAKVYHFLAERRGGRIAQEFQSQPLVLLKKPEPRWVNLSEAVWPDLSEVFGETYAYLETEYPQLKSYFVGYLGVPQHLDDELYAKAWLTLISRDNISSTQVEAALERIFPVMLRIARSDPKPDWWGQFCIDVRVWTQNDVFVEADRAYIPNDGELKRLFAKGGVQFVWRPEKESFADYEPLYQALGVRSLADQVSVSASLIHSMPLNGQQPLLTDGAKKALAWNLWSVARKDYERVKISGVLADLLASREMMADKLLVHYTLDWRIAEDSDGVAFFARKEKIFYRLQNAPEAKLAVEAPAMLARLLARGQVARELEDFIGRVLGSSSAKVEALLLKKNWSLPAEEIEWIDHRIAVVSKVEEEPTEVESFAEPMNLKVASDDETPDELGKYPRMDVPDGGLRRKKDLLDDPLPVEKGKQQENWERRPRGETHSGGSKRPVSTDQSGDMKLSYPRSAKHEHDGDDESRHQQTTQTRSEVEEAAIRRVEAYERGCGRTPEVKPKNNPGYDIESVDIDGNVRYIEVKGLDKAWSPQNPIQVTPYELEFGREEGPRFWLYVVEHARSNEQFCIYTIHNPVNEITHYAFDSGWHHFDSSERQISDKGEPQV